MDVGTQKRKIFCQKWPVLFFRFLFFPFFSSFAFSLSLTRERAVTRTRNANERTARVKREREREREKQTNRYTRGCVCLLTLAQFCERMHRKE